MDCVRMPGTDLSVSRLGLGSFTFGWQADEAVGQRMVEACLDRGINFFDTANVYSGGMAEEMLGKFVAGRRHQLVLGTKVYGPMGAGAHQRGLSRAAIKHAAEESLRRLRTDYIDVYYLHQPDYSVPIEESLAAMEELVIAGKVRYPAVSNYASWQVARMISIAERQAWAPIRVAQQLYNVLARGVEHEFVPMANELGVSIVAYNALAGGLLTGKQRRSGPMPGTRFARLRFYQDRYWHEEYFEALDGLSNIAAEAGRSVASVALNWLLHHTKVAVVLLGASSLQQLEQSLAAVSEGALAEATVASCDAIWIKFSGRVPRYNR